MLTSRERVRLALEHQEPDRVPTALGGGPYGMVDDLYFKLLDRFGLGAPIQPFRSGHNISYLDDRVFERLGVDTRYVWPGASPNSPSQQTADPNVFIDGFGQRWIRAVPYFYADRGILTEAQSIDDIERLVTWPDTTLPQWTAGVRERAQALQGSGYYVIARMVMSHGVFQTACDLRGMEQFMVDLSTNPEFAQHLLNRITATIDGLLRGYLQAAGDAIDMIELPGDDYASNLNLLMSPRMFRTFIKPSIQTFVNTIKSFRPDLKVMLHSDGMIEKLIPDLIDSGIDVVHPLEPLPAMNLGAIKAAYGDKLAFIGGIDISHAMPGTIDDVVDEVKRRIVELAPGGGYILAPSNHLQADVPPENVIALFDAARKYGTYPIRAS